MKIYIINLPKDIERRKNIESQLAESGMTGYEFVEGVDGRRTDCLSTGESFDNERLKKRLWEYASPGEVGCSLSHFKIWKKISAGNEPALVLEDDVIIERGFDKAVAGVDECMDMDRPEIMAVCHFCLYLKKRRMAGFDVVHPVKSWGSYCYFITPSAARLIVNQGNPHYLSDDWAYFRKKGVRFSAIFGFPVRHDECVHSNMGERCSWHKNWPKWKKLLMLARSMWWTVPLKFGLLRQFRQGSATHIT